MMQSCTRGKSQGFPKMAKKWQNRCFSKTRFLTFLKLKGESLCLFSVFDVKNDKKHLFSSLSVAEKKGMEKSAQNGHFEHFALFAKNPLERRMFLQKSTFFIKNPKKGVFCEKTRKGPFSSKMHFFYHFGFKNNGLKKRA